MGQVMSMTKPLEFYAQQPVLSDERNMATASVELKPKSIGEHYAALFAQYCDHVAQVAETRANLREIERTFQSLDACCIDTLSDRDVTERKEGMAKAIRNALIRHAAQSFAPEGVALQIDREALDERHPTSECEQDRRYGGRDLDTYRVNFDPKACWDYLEATYGGEAGKELAWKQAAAQLVDSFNLKYHPDVKQVSGKTVFAVTVVSEKGFGKVTLHYSSTARIEDRLRHLSTFAAWGQFEALAYIAQRLAGGHWYSRPLILREVIDLGDGCDLVTYHSKFLFRLAPAVAEKFQIFVSKYYGEVGQ